MGTLIHILSRRTADLSSRILVGRSRKNDLRIPDPRVSAEHALISWSGKSWQIRDLGSTNGTYVDGLLLEAGGQSRLRRGSMVSFGGPDGAWQLLSESPPLPEVWCEASDAPLDQAGPIVGIPSASDPEATLYWTSTGWVVDQDGSTTTLLTTTRLHVAGQEFEVRFPEALAGTLDGDPEEAEPGEPLSGFRFIFSSRPDVGVGMDAEGPSGRLHLRPRAHHATLRVLAQRRLEDSVAGRSPEESGWMSMVELAQLLGIERRTLNVHIYRARQELAQHGICGASGIVERRPASQALRFGGRTMTLLGA